MLVNKLINLENNDYKYDLKNHEIINFFIFDNYDNNDDKSLAFTLADNSKMNLFILSINTHNNKKFNIDVTHHGSNSFSFCEIKAINKNDAKSSFILSSNVDKDLKNIVVKQTVDGIMLNEKASILAIPSLNISTNSIDASHSVNVGKINPNFIFYLMTKRLNVSEAYSIILQSYFEKFLTNATDLKLHAETIQNEIKKLFDTDKENTWN